MQSLSPEEDSGTAFDENVFHRVQLRVMDASSSDLTMADEIVDDAVHVVTLLRDALVCGEPLATAAALGSADAFLAQFAAPVPFE